ncbi:hypothetical protein OR1_00836 [Geobacter sp. OR-1]|uniref:ABC transporter substrate-binding protein n=1 Tax=Geobacter sp. OR-1 TaxID=1266765 RepID=UPI0005436D67|nr:ABC transporter substrate-binding protein [Geobacter sp. OR-1]GAM08564.1 hypothetical protein OR1_00836 [Geobacter sp. OR-1]
MGCQKARFLTFFWINSCKKNRIATENLQIVDISHTEIADALKRGDIDAFAGSDFAYLKGKRVISNAQRIVFTEPGLTNHAACLVVRRDWLAANRGTAQKVLKALLKAEKEFNLHPEELTSMLAGKLDIKKSDLEKILAEQHNGVMLDQVLLLALEDEARWMRETGMVKGAPLPNYLHFMDQSVLRSVDPTAVKLK